MRIGIYGLTGYTGLELVKILRRHPEAEIVFGTSESWAGRRLSEAMPTTLDLRLLAAEEAGSDSIDTAFLCLPHGASARTAVGLLEAGVQVIDLSADFRLRDPAVYQRTYGQPHPAPELLAQAVYGLTEVARPRLPGVRLVANPGCYPTSVLLGLHPLASQGLLDGQVIVDAKSGVSGAGRKPSLATHFVEANENVSPYQVGRVHRHLPEMEQELGLEGLVFVPHLVPLNQGLLSTMYVRLSRPLEAHQLQALYQEVWAGEPFVRVLPPGQQATMRHAVQTNLCVISLTWLEPQQVIVTSAIDNLIKGAGGQAVQNWNASQGWPETEGLV